MPHGREDVGWRLVGDVRASQWQRHGIDVLLALIVADEKRLGSLLENVSELAIDNPTTRAAIQHPISFEMNDEWISRRKRVSGLGQR